MKTRKFNLMKNTAAAVLTAAALLPVFPAAAAPQNPNGNSIQKRIQSTVQNRVDLLTRLVADCEKQYKNGSLGGMSVLKAQTALYRAKILLMKVKAGLPAEPGIAIAMINLYAASAHADDLRKRSAGGNMCLYILLNTQIQANDAELKYLNELRKCKNPGIVENVRKKLPVFDPAKRLNDKLLEELFQAELQSR